MKFESLIFDIDGTIWDSRGLVAQGYNQVLTAAGYSQCCATVDQLAKLFGKTTTEIADLLIPCVPVPERYRLMEECMEASTRIMWSDPCRIAYEGVVETFEKLAENHRLFIVSNSESGYPQLCMEKLGISHLFQGHLCYGDTHTEKGETIKTLMARHGIGSAAYIGDTQGDCVAAAEANIPFIFAAYGFGEPRRYDERIEKISDLLALEL